MSNKNNNTNTNTEDLRAELEALRAENEQLRLKKAQEGQSIKVSAKQAVSAYGMGKWPITLYAKQWIKLFGMVDDIKAFIKANVDNLAFKKPEDKAEVEAYFKG